MVAFYSCLLVLFLFLNVKSEYVDTCYEGTNYWSGKKLGNKRTCDPETKYCYILMGSAATSPTSSRGCAPDYIDTYCDKYRSNPSSATEFCFTINTFDMKGKLCCCNSNSNCNSTAATTVSLPIIFIFVFYLLMFFKNQ